MNKKYKTITPEEIERLSYATMAVLLLIVWLIAVLCVFGCGWLMWITTNFVSKL